MATNLPLLATNAENGETARIKINAAIGMLNVHEVDKDVI